MVSHCHSEQGRDLKMGYNPFPYCQHPTLWAGDYLLPYKICLLICRMVVLLLCWNHCQNVLKTKYNIGFWSWSWWSSEHSRCRWRALRLFCSWPSICAGISCICPYLSKQTPLMHSGIFMPSEVFIGCCRSFEICIIYYSLITTPHVSATLETRYLSSDEEYLRWQSFVMQCHVV